MSNKEFTVFINLVLKPHGFSRKGNYWYRSTDEMVKVVNSQKSSFSNLYYLNYGFYIKALQNEEPDLHYFTGLGSSNDKIRNRIKELLDLHNNITDEIRQEELKSLIEGIIITTLQEVDTEVDFSSFLNRLPSLKTMPLFLKRRYNIT